MNAELVKSLRNEVVERLTIRRQDEELFDVAEERLVVRQIISDVLDDYAQAAIVGAHEAIDQDTEGEIAQALFDSLLGLGQLQPLLDDLSIENINANGCDRVIVGYADGTRQQVAPIADSDAELVELIRTAAARLGSSERRFDMGAPIVNLRLPDGSRMAAVMAVSERPSLSIRRHRHLSVDLDELTRIGTLTSPVRDLLQASVLARRNIMVTGGTNAGKTTLLRALIAAIPEWERLITVEDSRELGVSNLGRHVDVLSLEQRDENVEGEGAITLADLVRQALRMSPDRCIVGEVRGEAVIDMMNAMSQGDDGSLSTIHANSSHGVFGRIATYAIQSSARLPLEATNLLIANSLNLVVFIRREPKSGRRFVSSIREVVGAEGPHVISNEIVRMDRDGSIRPGARMTEELEEHLDAVGFDTASFYELGRWS